MPPLRLPRPVLCLALAAALGCGSDAPPPERVIGTEEDDAVRREVAAARGRLGATEGGRRVLRAIDAHGGLDAWYRTPTSAFAWTYASRDADLHLASSLVADNRTRRVYHELRALGPYGDPRPTEGRLAWDGDAAWVAPATLTALDPRLWATAGYYLAHVPFVLADPGLRYDPLPDDTLDGRAHRLVRVGYGADAWPTPGEALTLYLHPDTWRVAAVRYVPAHADAETLLRYEGYVTVDGLTVPTRLRGFAYESGRLGPQRSEARADSLSFRRPFDEARLRAPAGARFSPLREAG